MAFMPMVPLSMKEENMESHEDYEPKVVSFGPYHHGKEKLKFIEDFKPYAVKMFIEDMNKSDFMAAILEEIEYTKSCYLEDQFTRKYTDEQFAEMMLKDACVILNYFGLPEIENSDVEAETINYHLGPAIYHSIRRDMYLLENQIPFRILEILIGLKSNTPTQEFIKKMEELCFKMFFNDKNGLIDNDLGKKPYHLLEIFRRVIVTGVDHGDVISHKSRCDINKLRKCLKNNSCRCWKNDGNGIANPHGLYAFRSVTDLKSKGIHLRASGIKSLKGIRFSPTQLFCSAELKLPLVYVDMYTRVFFKNMMAFEFAPQLQKSIIDKSVTAYVSFMKLLVAKTQDVKELREKRIIINTFGSDDDVVQLYKSLNTYEAEDNSSYSRVKADVNQHYESKIKMWMADFRNKYFNNPWTIIALVAYFISLCLDILQTHYTMHPPNSDNGKGKANPPSSPR